MTIILIITPVYHNIQHVTFLKWNLSITVGILGSLGQELDPVFHLGDTAVNPVAGALTPIANNSHLGESEYIE